MRKYLLLFILVLFIYSCGNDEPVKTVHEQVIAEAGFKADDEAVQGKYKRYTGSIAGQPVVLNLAQYNNEMLAEYYYEKIGIPITLYKWQDSNMAANEYILTEYPPDEVDEERAKWRVTIAGDSIAGTWLRGDVSYPIVLKENKRDDVQRFSIISVIDSIRLIDSLAAPKATFKYQVLLPIGMDEGSAFVQSVILESMGCDTGKMSQCLEKMKQTYAAQYKTISDGMPVEEIAAPFNNWYEETGYTVIYNENDIVVLDNNVYEYTGGAHGNYGSVYMNIDRKNKKLWKLEDIMTVDSAKLVPLLEVEARKRFGLKKNQPLNAHLFSNELYVPENKGITFSYGLYEIASYADGMVELYIPYNKIMQQLNAEFIQRMKLEAVAVNK